MGITPMSNPELVDISKRKLLKHLSENESS